MMRVLFLTGSDSDAATAQLLASHAPDLAITAVATPADVVAAMGSTPGWQALFVSPTVAQSETLSLIANLRRNRTPVAIVPMVDEAHQDVFAEAVAAGADDVLVKRGTSLVNITETLARIRQSPHLFPADARRRLQVLYAGRDALVWNLIEQIPFVKAERVTVGVDGACPVRAHGAADGSLRCDVVVVDEQPGEAHPLQVVKSVKSQASDLPVVVLTASTGGDVATAALELGADDTVLKTGIFRRRLIATLRRVHQRLEFQSQYADLKGREARLRQIVENVPVPVGVVASDGAVLAMNGAGLATFGATKPREVVGRDLRTLVAVDDHAAVTEWLHRVTRGEPGSLAFRGETLTGTHIPLLARAAVLERDAKGNRGMIVTFAPTPVAPQSPAVEPSSEQTAAMAARLAAALDELERERAAFQEERARATHEARQIEEQLRAETVRSGEAGRTIEALRQELVHTEDRLRQATQQVEDGEAASEANVQALSAVSAQLAEGHARTSALERELATQREALDRATAEIGALRAAITDRERALAETEQQRQDLERRVADAEHTRHALEPEIATQHAALERALAEVDALRATIDDRDQALARSEQQRAALQQRVTQVESRAAELDARAAEIEALREADRARAEARPVPDAWAHERQQLSESLSALQADYASLAEALATERTARDRDARELQALRATIDRDDALRADHDERLRQSHQDAAARAEARERELAERCQLLTAQLVDAERRLTEAEQRAEYTLRSALESAPAAEPPVEPAPDAGLRQVGAFAAAMVPTLEALMTAVVRSARHDRPATGPAVPAGVPEATDEMVTQAGVLVRQLAAFTRRQAERAAPVDLNLAVAHAEPMLAQLVGGYVAFEVRLGAGVVFQISQADLDQLLTSLVIAGRDALPAGGSLILETAGGGTETEQTQHDRTTARADVILTALGYGARAIADAPALARVAERTGGTLTIDGDEGWKVRLAVQLSASQAASGDWTWLTDAEARRPLGTATSRKVTIRD